MVVRMRHTKSKRNRIRSHHALSRGRFVVCQKCKAETLSHLACLQCGFYGGKEVINVFAKLDKKERKKKEKELHAHEEESAQKGKTLSAEELSHK